jgi:DNA polymerase-3 subunit alpha
MGLDLLPPDVNESDEGFTPAENSVRFGLSAIKGMGSAAARAIIEARNAGQFSSLFDFVSRIDQAAVNRRTLESLISAGAFDSIIPVDMSPNLWRSKLHAAIDDALHYGQSSWNDRERGQSGLFGSNETGAAPTNESLPDAAPWTQAEISAHEKATVGFYLSAHPLDDFAEVLSGLGIRNIGDHESLRSGQQLIFAGVVSGLQVRWSKKGNRFAQFRVEDRSAGVKCLMWAEAFGKYADIVENDSLLILEARIEVADGQDLTAIVSEVRSLSEARSRHARSAIVTLPEREYDEAFLQAVCSVLNSSHGRCEVYLKFPVEGLSIKLRSGPIRVEGSRRLEKELESLECSICWTV